MFNLERFSRLPRRSPTLREPERLLFSSEGHAFEHLRFVGEGPHGEAVLLARRHPPRGRPTLVVVKALSVRGRRKARERLAEEVRLVSRLAHPGIARVFGHYEREEMSYTVAELVEGTSLATALCDAALLGRPLSEELGLVVCAEVAGALHYAHTLADERGQPLGIVHRDVCPSNIRVARGGQVKLTGFGVAWSNLPGREETTEDGEVLGDADYAPPERLRAGGARQHQGVSGDLFSLGLVLLELVTGQHLYYVEPLDRRVAHVRTVSERGPWAGWDGKPLSLEELRVRADCFGPRDVEYATRGLSEPLRAVLHKLLRREPSERHASGEELRAELLRCLKGRRWWGVGRRRVARELYQLRVEAVPLWRQAEALGTFRTVDAFENVDADE
jgi:serine/threonine-protein kinase